MNWRKWPYWVKGGIIAIPAAILLLPMTFALARFFGAGEDLIMFIAPELLIALMGLGMRGTPAGILEIIGVLGLFGLITLLRIFVMGAVLGLIYGKVASKKTFWTCLILIWLLLTAGIAYKTASTFDVYYSSDSSEDCRSLFNKGINKFDTNWCYKELAVKKQDYTICDNIQEPSSIEKFPEDYKAFCYESVAQAKQDPSICPLIPPYTLTEYGKRNRRDACYVHFTMCGEVVDEGWKEQCYLIKALRESDDYYCELIHSGPIRDQCFYKLQYDSGSGLAKP